MNELKSEKILHPVDRISPSDLLDMEFRSAGENDWGNSKLAMYHRALEAAEKQVRELQKTIKSFKVVNDDPY